MFILKRASGNFIFMLAVLALSLLDIALLEKWYGLFTGGFQLVGRIATTGDRLFFCGAVLVIEAGTAGCFWYVLHIIGLIRRTPLALTRYLFLVLYGGASITALVLKYGYLAYFGRFLSLAVLRNLGGGSVVEALSYGKIELLMFGAWLVPGITLGWLCFKWIAARLPAVQSSVPVVPRIRQQGWRLLICLALLAGVVATANASASMRRQLRRITFVGVAQRMIETAIPQSSVLEQFAQGLPAPEPERTAQVSFGALKDNLILIVSETTRADVLDADVDGVPVTPAWRALAREGGSAAHYYSHTGFTMSSMKAMFLGSLDGRRPLGGSLFELLKREGYQVIVVSGQDESFGDIAKESGEAVADMFFDARSARNERVYESDTPGSLALSNRRVVEQFETVAREVDWSRPVFFYINLQAAHFPYNYPDLPRTLDAHPLERQQISAREKAHVQLTYHNAVAYSDWATGRIVQKLKAIGVFDRSLVVVSGDHGESLFDDGILGHGIRLAEKQLHTLLIANRKLPAFDGLLGQNDLAAELLKGIGAKVEGYRAHEPVLHIIGSRTKPDEIGYTYPDGKHFSLDVSDREVSADWMPAPVPVEMLKPHSREYDELRKLARDWKDQIRQ